MVELWASLGLKCPVCRPVRPGQSHLDDSRCSHLEVKKRKILWWVGYVLKQWGSAGTAGHIEDDEEVAVDAA